MNNEAKSKTIEKAKEMFFEIPSYQRLYEWEKDQIETLLEDVKKVCFDTQGGSQEKNYFIGNVVVSKQKKDKESKYILIDGQQRLTTLFLIGVYLASEGQREWNSFVKSSNNKLRISMPLRENEEKWLLELINKGKKFRENLKSSPSVHKKIFEGLVVIQNWFDQNTRVKDVFSSFLYEKVCFALIELADKTDLNQFFVRMNNRGKQLEKHEILKARLLNIIKKDINWQKYAKIWDLCSDMDKYIFQSAGDRKFLNGNLDKQSDKQLCDILCDGVQIENKNRNGNGSDLEKVKSIIDFPTFLLHVAKLISEDKNVLINKDKLLEIIVVSKGCTQSKEPQETKILLFNDSDEHRVKKFILEILKYRILFDYFVIKQMVDERLGKQGEYAIKRLSYNQSNKSYTIAEGNAMENLAKIQNYLRVARAGDKQNYHHWLTPFLSKVAEKKQIRCDCEQDKIKIDGIFQNEKMKSIQNWLLAKHVSSDSNLDNLVDFLEELDTDLAYAQMGKKPKGGDNDSLLAITQQYLKGANSVEWNENGEVDFDGWVSKKLNQGVGTPHYWFYRLEYYLWKNGVSENVVKKDFEIDGKTFKRIREKYRFKGLNSVEHIQPQSKKDLDDWKGAIIDGSDIERVDCFGNLALISQSFNSSLSNQDTGDKILDLRKKINKDDVESLKLWLAYAKMESQKDNKKEWTYAIAEEHQTEMLDILKASLKNKEQNRG